MSVALSALSLVGRWRRGGSLERAQLKWVASAAAFAAVVMGSYGVVIGPGAFNEVFDFLVGLALGFFPIAIGIAILRYHLFEIDRLVSRTIAYALITAILVATYAAVILVLQGPLGNLLGGDTVSVALSTLVVAALFQPLRRRIQRAVDGRFDRARFDGERTSAAFSERLRHETDIAMVVTDLDCDGALGSPADLARVVAAAEGRSDDPGDGHPPRGDRVDRRLRGRRHRRRRPRLAERRRVPGRWRSSPPCSSRSAG